MLSSKKLTCKGTLMQVFICPRPITPYPHPLTHCVSVYSILIHTGKGGVEGRRVKLKIKGEGQLFPKAGSKIPT